MTSRIDLTGYKILITGASTGIGAAAGRTFAECGASVCLHYNRNKDLAEKLAESISGQGGQAQTVSGDLAISGGATKVVNTAIAKLGGLDVLVNNAGALVRSPLANYDDALFEQVFALSTRSVAEATRAAYPALKQSSHASVINLGSIAGRNGGAPGSGLYAASKAAVHSLTRSMALEFATDRIRVNAIAPGFMATPFHNDTPLDRQEATRQTIPMGRLGTAEDCVWALAFLASVEMSGYITGQILDINGGQLRP
jgi:3-oxoacyl-[acyl-carrier protein] reductase